jgi:PHP family Zn ribbon phosphoesterase
MALTDLDLHIHTPYVPADYRGPLDTTPRTLVETALAAGLSVIAVTDHCTVDFVHHVSEAAELHAAETGEGLLVLPGAEIKARWGMDEAHLVVLFPPDSYRVCFADLAHRLGIDGRVIRTEELPAVKVAAHPRTVAEHVAELGGISHIAHADRYFGSYRLLDAPLFDELTACSAIAAVDLVDLTNAAQVRRRANGALVISSSDAHSPAEIGRRRTTLWLDEPSMEAVLRAVGLSAGAELPERCLAR